MKNFKVALTAEKGSTITDGTYNFKDNGVENGHGISLAGTVKGTSRDSLKITADDKCDAIFYGPGVTFENATINVKSQTPAWTEAYDLTLKNSSLTVAGFGGPDGSRLAYYVNKLNMDNSEFVINKNGNGGHRTGLTIQGAATINNSRIIDNAGDHAGISVCPDAKLDVTNSTLEFKNGGERGLNIHGKVKLTNSKIQGDGRNGKLYFLNTDDKGSIEHDSSSSISESASENEEASNPNVEHIQQEDINLPTDLSTGDNTATTAYKVAPGQTIDFTGAITTSVVKEQMKAIENNFKTAGKEDYNDIALSNMTASFMATFTIPDGLTLPDNITKDTLKLDGVSDTFAIQDVQVKDKTVTVKINLKSGITTYAALQAAVQTLGKAMKITIPGIKINKDFSGKATIVGTVKGNFHAAATFKGTTKIFDFTWNGSQTSDGKNFDAAASANGISLTVEYDPLAPLAPVSEYTPVPEPTLWPKHKPTTEKTQNPTTLPKENPNNKIVEKRKNGNNQLPKTGSSILLTAFSAILTFGLAGVIAQLKRIKINK
ncbi:hypothetical protein [Gardnerella vaginalis]|uniref:hypothetical protein n=1 Tax=Gardnerella vaginalis TaxID=2702 RepID=UPI0039F11D36